MVVQRVLRLKPRFDAFEDVILAFRSGNYSECLAALADNHHAGAASLKIRVLHRLGRFDDAAALVVNKIRESSQHPELAELYTLRGMVETAMGRAQSAAESLTEARVRSYASGSTVLEAEAEYATAFLSWTRAEFVDAQKAAAKTLEVRPGPHFLLSRQPVGYVGTLYETRAKAFDLLGALAAVREDYEEQASLISLAFEQLERAKHSDHFYNARLLFNFAALVRDLDVPGGREFVSERLEKIEFVAHTKLYEFHTRRCLGWSNANYGDVLGALRQFRASSEAAPSDAWRILAVLDRALLARESREQMFALEELDHAQRLAKSVNWDATRDEERFALFVLAQHLAPANVAAARMLLDRYNRSKNPLPVSSFGSKDRRLRADVCYATGTVLRYENAIGAAIGYFQECFEVWTQIGYASRAAVVAADLAELTQRQHYFDVAAREARRRPSSWLARRLKALAEAQ